MNRRCVVVGEPVDAPVDDRDGLRTSLDEGLARTNEALREHLVAPFSVLRGAENSAASSPTRRSPPGHCGNSPKRSSRSRCASRSSTAN